MKLLIADDEPDVRDAIAEIVAEDFAEVLQAEDGRRAVEVAIAERPQVVLLDLLMPGISGIDACRQLRALPEFDSVPIVVLTGYRSSAEAEAAFAAGATDYMVKPFAIGELRARLRTWALRAGG